MDRAVVEMKGAKRAVISHYARADDHIATRQVVTVVTLLGLTWLMVARSAAVAWGVAVLIVLLALLQMRVFALLHECGHGSLFATQRLNRLSGSLLGMLCGMPQYVWSQHHLRHHATNGDWERHRGTLNVLSVDEYAALSAAQQRKYRLLRHVALAPYAGFMYLVVNPRLNWLRGICAFLIHLVREKWRFPSLPWRAHKASFTTRRWASPAEFRDMSINNLAQLLIWIPMCVWLGPRLFLLCHFTSLAFAGGATIVLFASQHNFEHAYAADTARWDYDTSTLRGTSFMLLPDWLHWFTANAAYHHVHHLSAAIPNYRLRACHEQHELLFTEVYRVRLGDLRRCLRCILWDRAARRIISIDEYDRRSAIHRARA